MDYVMYKVVGLFSSSKGLLKIMDYEFKMRLVIRFIFNSYSFLFWIIYKEV